MILPPATLAILPLDHATVCRALIAACRQSGSADTLAGGLDAYMGALDEDEATGMLVLAFQTPAPGDALEDARYLARTACGDEPYLPGSEYEWNDRQAGEWDAWCSVTDTAIAEAEQAWRLAMVVRLAGVARALAMPQVYNPAWTRRIPQALGSVA